MTVESALRIGYYVHHHGRGHATRAEVIGGALERRGHAVTYLGSGALPPGAHVVLTPDDSGNTFPDAEANGRLHWAPLAGGYPERAQEIATWIARTSPDVVVVDVSVEVTALVRLLGVPVVVVAQPGVRDDAPHTLAFDLAAAVLAPWPDGLSVAPHLSAWADKVVCVGGLTRFAGTGCSAGDPTSASLRGVFLVGGEGWDDRSVVDAIKAATPQVAWRTPSRDCPVDALLEQADLVVAHGGQNAIADVAVFEVPALVLAQARPFDEQSDMARALDETGIAAGLPAGAAPAQVLARLQQLIADLGSGRRPGDWSRWQVDGAVDRACDVIEKVAYV